MVSGTKSCNLSSTAVAPIKYKLLYILDTNYSYAFSLLAGGND